MDVEQRLTNLERELARAKRTLDAMTTGSVFKVNKERTLLDGTLNVTGSATVGPLVLTGGDELTIAGGVVTATHSRHTIDTEGDADSDDLDTINGGTTGQLLVLRTVTSTRDVTLTESGNIKLGGTSRVLDNSNDRILLIYGGTYWHELGFGDNG